MADPIVEQIAQKIETRLRAGTYTEPHALTEVIRPTRQHRNFRPGHLVCLVQQGDSTPTEVSGEEVGQGNPMALNFAQVFHIMTWIKPSDLDETPVEKIVNLVRADELKAITSSASWMSWDGLAKNSEYDWNVAFDDDGNPVLIIELTVFYRVSSVDHYTQR